MIRARKSIISPSTEALSQAPSHLRSLLCVVIALVPGLLLGCGVGPTRGIPPPADDLVIKRAGSAAQQTERLWLDLTKQLGLSYSSPLDSQADTPEALALVKSESTLEGELETYPTTVSENIDATTKTIIQGFIKPTEAESASAGTDNSASSDRTTSSSPFHATRCARIEAFNELTSIAPSDPEAGTRLEGIKVYKLQYVLEDKTPTQFLGLPSPEGSLGDKIVRTALLTVPHTASLAAGKKVPLALYGHGGDSGLSYNEIARIFGPLQSSLVVAAPAFPEEVVCAGDVSPITKTCRGGDSETVGEATPKGTLRPFDSDADEILGLQNCIARAIFTSSSNQTIQALGFAVESEGLAPSAALTKLLTPLLQTYGDGASSSLRATTNAREAALLAEPRSLIFGSSRGAATGLIALAKSGAAQRSEDTLPSGASLSHFHCGALLFPPTTFSMGRLRLGLELFVKGLARSSVFYALPVAPALSSYFDDYRQGNVTAEVMAKRYMLIDPLFSAQLVASALRDWSQPGSVDAAAAGHLLMMHGRLDRVVGAENTFFYAQKLGQLSSGLRQTGLAPGVKIAAISFEPVTEDVYPTGNPLADFLYQHGDDVFARSLSIPDAAEGPALSTYLRTLRRQTWNLAASSGTPEEFASDLMGRSGKKPSEVLKDYLAGSCPVDTGSPQVSPGSLHL